MIKAMDKEKIFVLLEDDVEVLGNGQGHVFYREYLPVSRYLTLLKKYGLVSTFYVDMAHYLFLKENSHCKDFGLQAGYMEQTILNILKNGMEIQLHLHSQWVDAHLVDNEIQVTNMWNIGKLQQEEQVKLVTKAMESLTMIINKSDSINPITSFRTGSWGMQPYQTLYTIFEKLGIKTVMGPIKGLKIPRLGIDYTHMQSGHCPYYCKSSDINAIGDDKGSIVLPMTPTYLSLTDLIRYSVQVKWKGFLKKYDHDLDLNKTVLSTVYKDPTAGKDVFNFSLRPFKTHLKMNAQPFWLLKKTFRRSYEMVLHSKHDFKLMVVETHSKDFKNSFGSIEKFFDHITTKYDNLQFVTANELLKLVNEKKVKPLVKDI
ncbi:hypothetical protein ACFQZJ_06645 [Maribacter chungangensis]|uniref:NodB homology domain-containing protein n=1 Tax=Maribacter chungangensis TaxID=1069117 RepID=A0ABW3B2Q1_9FLAO